MAETHVQSRGRRALGILLALVAGFAVGTLCSFKYRYGLAGTPLTTPVPIGLVATLVLVGVFLLALRVAFATRRYAAFAAVGLLGAVAVYSVKGPGGSLVIVGDSWGNDWTVASVVIGLIVVAAPAIRHRRRASNAEGPDGPAPDGMMNVPSEGSTLT